MPDLSRLLNLIEQMPVYRQLLEGLKKRGDSNVVVLDAAKPYLIAALYESLRLPMLVVTAQPEGCKKLHEQLLSWCHSSQVKLFPEPDALPYERLASDTATELERVQVLTSLVGCNSGESDADAPLVVASAPAIMGKTPLHSDFISTCHTIKLGMNIDPLRLLGKWEAMGYRMESMVEVPGTMSHRGGIIDVYPPTSELPVRLEFFGDTIDSIRFFDPVTQRSTDKVSSVAVGPATELLAPRLMDKRELERSLRES